MKLLNTDFLCKDLYIKQDVNTGLIAIIAIHNLKNGPALGGCRFVAYPTVDDAILDAMNLAKAMTYKSALAGLPLGGGKSVIISHPGIKDRKKLFESFGDFVNEFKGTYITASDSGSTEEDMKIVALRTPHVTGINKTQAQLDDTAGMTAIGLVRAFEAVAKYRFNQSNLDGLHIAIQGIGNVGFLTAKMLIERGARLTITDKDKQLAAERAQILSANLVEPEQIAEVECDIFSPCALGGILNQSSIEKLKTTVICGAANNQLREVADGEELKKKGILYIPDYVANAGGVICAAAQAGVITREDSYNKTHHIYDSVLEVINLSEKLQLPTNIIANNLAEKLFS